jgi:hypothetical protein
MLMISATLWLFITGKYPVFILPKAEWASGPLWTCTENIAPPRFDPRIHPARSKSLYRPRSIPAASATLNMEVKYFLSILQMEEALLSKTSETVSKGMTSLPRRQYYL